MLNNNSHYGYHFTHLFEESKNIRIIFGRKTKMKGNYPTTIIRIPSEMEQRKKETKYGFHSGRHCLVKVHWYFPVHPLIIIILPSSFKLWHQVYNFLVTTLVLQNSCSDKIRIAFWLAMTKMDQRTDEEEQAGTLGGS